MVLVPKVVDALSIPVIASGGIGDGRGLMAALSLGAEGIEMGTRFIATTECLHAHPIYKEMLVKGTENDTVVIKRSIGAPARAIHNKWTKEILARELSSEGYEGLKEYISGMANKRFIYDGEIEQGFAWAGQVMGLIEDVPSAGELIKRIIHQAEEIRRDWTI
jgi:enoyl-[acyl-carrier protein] reductase II